MHTDVQNIPSFNDPSMHLIGNPAGQSHVQRPAHCDTYRDVRVS